MNIHPVDHDMNVHRVPPGQQSKRVIGSADSVAPAVLSRPIEGPLRQTDSEVDSTSTPRDTDTGTKTPGVIRLLEAGHFKGVADVRLRINFFDELSDRAAAAAVPVVEEQVEDLLATVSGAVDEIVTSLAVDNEARTAISGLIDGFDALVRSAVDEYGSAGDALASALDTAFGGLVGAIGEILVGGDVGATEGPDNGLADSATPRPIGTDDVVEVPFQGMDNVGDAGDEVGPVAAPSVDEAIAALTSTFRETLTSLIESIQSATTLPDPSAPNGKGRAYAKFLAIYDDLRGLTPAVDERA